MTSVGERMRSTIHPDDAPAAERQLSRVDTPELEAPKTIDPPLDPEIGERIRSLLREGDYEAAAAYAEKVMASVGIDPAPELPTSAQPGGDRDRSGPATDASDAGDQAVAMALPLPRTKLAEPTGPRGDERLEAAEGGHPSY
jgi:hypothetical protein